MDIKADHGVPISMDCTILVNSTDSFEDCWVPFFTLLSAYWPGCTWPIVLNTETKDFSFPGLNITCSKVGKAYRQNGRPPWGWCLKQCLSQIQTDLILYVQEDYFLEGAVDVTQIKQLVEFMSGHSWSRQDCAHIGLTHFGSHSPFHLTEDPLLWEVDRQADYRLSLQAGLWKTASLLQYVKNDDTGWNFEELGSHRAWRMNERFLTVNRHIFNPDGRQIFPYTHTGIIRGKWNKDAVVDLFAQHAIDVDFSIRGFYSAEAHRARQRSLAGKINGKIRNAMHRANMAIDRLRSI